MGVEDKAVAKQPTAVPNMNSAEQPDEKAERLRGGCPFLPLCWLCWPAACCLGTTAVAAGAAGGAATSR